MEDAAGTVQFPEAEGVRADPLWPVPGGFELGRRVGLPSELRVWDEVSPVSRLCVSRDRQRKLKRQKAPDHTDEGHDGCEDEAFPAGERRRLHVARILWLMPRLFQFSVFGRQFPSNKLIDG
jgi:hypothetical protein